MTFEEYYGDNYPVLKEIERHLLELLDNYPVQESLEGVQPIIYCKSRIKTPESMIDKLERQNLPTDCDTAMRQMHDAVGIRVICSFVDDVYAVADWICARSEYEVINRKDYMAYPKPNGYRSLHLILRIKEGAGKGMEAEIQLRTIAIDFWAALEHQIKYKHQVKNEKLMRDELKRCADEIASVDMSMQTIRDAIQKGDLE